MADQKQTLHISLIPEGGEVFRAVNVKRRVLAFIIFLILCVLAVMGAAVILRGVKRDKAKQVAVLVREIDGVNLEIAKLEGDYKEVARLGNQLNAARILLAQHPSFIKVLELIEARTLPEVYYSNFIGSSDGRTFVLEAKAPSFDEAARQIVAFREIVEKIEKVTVSTVSSEVGETGAIKNVKFTITLVVSGDAF